MKYFGGCDVGSTYTKCIILDENGKIVANVTNRSKINPVASAEIALADAVAQVEALNSAEELTYLIGTGYGRNKVPFADENISEISCHAMGVHVTNPDVKAIIDIGGQDVKGISIDTDGTVKNFAMNDKCSAGTGRFFEAMARSFELSLPEFSKLSLNAKNVIPITAQCTVFAESEVITLVGEGKAMDEIAAGIEMAVAKRCFVMAKKAGATDSITLTGGFSTEDQVFKALSIGASSIPAQYVSDGYKTDYSQSADVILDRKALKDVDYPLLLTFCFFFIFSGNMARIDAVRELFSTLLHKNTLVVSTLSCQVISNVPSAILLSQFTNNYADLLVGVNIGGVGTLISSLASLITFREYVKHNPGKTGYYIGMFSLFNFAFLFILTGFMFLLKLF